MNDTRSIRNLSELIVPERGISYGVVQPGEICSDGVPIIRVTDVRDGRIACVNPLRVRSEIESKHARSRLRGGELLLTLVGTVGETAIVPPALIGWNTARSVGVLPICEDPGAKWVYYVLRSRDSQTRIQEWCNTTVQATLNLRDVARLPIIVLPKREREAIEAVLTVLDEKINLNRIMGETSDAMALAFFKSWFVDFDPVRAKAEGRPPVGMNDATAALFSGRFATTEFGPVPEGWAIRPLSSVCSLDKGVSYKGDLLHDSGVPMINLGCFKGDGAFDVDRVKGYRGEVRDTHWVLPGDLLLANTDMTQNRVVLGSPALVPHYKNRRFIFSHHVFAVRFLCEMSPGLPLYCFYVLRQPEFRTRAAGFATGTTVLALPRDAVLGQSIVLPPPEILECFKELVSPMLALKEKNDAESQSLARIRDQILPRLLSGELRVRDTVRCIEAVL